MTTGERRRRHESFTGCLFTKALQKKKKKNSQNIFEETLTDQSNTTLTEILQILRMFLLHLRAALPFRLLTSQNDLDMRL